MFPNKRSIVFLLLLCYTYTTFPGINFFANPFEANLKNLNLKNRFELTKQIRSFDGYGNNKKNFYWGGLSADIPKLADSVFGDVFGNKLVNRGNPRELSNIIGQISQQEIPDNENGLTMFFTLFGQFLDHDLDFVKPSGVFKALIQVPKGDLWFDKYSKGGKTIQFSRSVFHYKHKDGPLGWLNTVTSFLDLSVIYGSDPGKQFQLRSYKQGKLKMDKNMLIRDYQGNFIAGDLRTSQNIGLTSIITLFVREHNKQCDQILSVFPTLKDQQVFHLARNRLIGIVQKITFKEWLPLLLGKDGYNKFVGAQSTYDQSINPTINLQFLTAGFRFGHSMIHDKINLFDHKNEKVSTLTLQEMFQSSKFLQQSDDIDITLNGIMRSPTKKRTHQIVNGLRNLLIQIPGIVQDLFALNVQRGRDHGMPDYNTVRTILGFNKLKAISELSKNKQTVKRLNQAYRGNINNIDLWVGIICEDSIDGGNLGLVGSKIVGQTFKRLRNGDRFWYEWAYPEEEIKYIQQFSMKNIIQRNTELQNVPSGFILPIIDQKLTKNVEQINFKIIQEKLNKNT